MKLTWHSNAPWMATGYGVQTRLFVPRLIKAGYETACINYVGLQGAVINWNGIICFPSQYHPYGMDVITPHSKAWGADAVITLTDAWVVEPAAIQRPLRWIAWYPVDCDPMPLPVRNAIAGAWKRISFSKSGVKATMEAGLDCDYVPHAVDTTVYKPTDKAEARQKMFANNPELYEKVKDRFLVTTVAMNKGFPTRKSFPEMLEAFRNCKQRHSDWVYYLHTAMCPNGENNGVPLDKLCQFLGLVPGEDVIFADPYQMWAGMPEEWMANMYSASDVHLLASTGEGFGIPTLEAQACGCPVIVGDWTASSELCFSGQKIDKRDADAIYTPGMAYQFKPRIRAIEIALESEHKKPSSRERARKGALAYDVETVFDNYMLPVMKRYDDEIMADNAKNRIILEEKGLIEKEVTNE
jgi:glycosyltransferase involved in cell wall biosynthesis